VNPHLGRTLRIVVCAVKIIMGLLCGNFRDFYEWENFFRDFT